MVFKKQTDSKRQRLEALTSKLANVQPLQLNCNVARRGAALQSSFLVVRVKQSSQRRADEELVVVVVARVKMNKSFGLDQT